MEYLSTGAAPSNAVSKMNRGLLVHFVESFEKTDLDAHFNIGRSHVKQFQKWIMFSNAFPAKKIADLEMAEASARSRPLMIAMFASFPDPNHQKKGTKQVRQILRASLALVTYTENDPRVREFHYILIRAGQSSEALINRGQFLLIASDSARRGSVAMLDVITPSFL